MARISHGVRRTALGILIGAVLASALLVATGSTSAAPGPTLTTHGTVAGWAVVNVRGRLLAGGGIIKVVRIQRFGVYAIDWGQPLPSNCATTATVDLAHSPSTENVRLPDGASVPFVAGYAVADSNGKPGGLGATTVDTFDQRGKPTPLAFDVTVVC